MANDLIKETIGLTRPLGRESTQLLEEGDIIVPDIKPDMDYILKSDADAAITKVDVSAGRVSFSGRLMVKTLYIAKGADHSVQSIVVNHDIADSVVFDGVDKDDWVEVSADIANIDYKMLSDRKLSFRAVIDVNAAAETKSYFDAVSEIGDLSPNQMRRRQLSVKKTVENRADRIQVRDELPLPQAKPDIRELLQTNISVANKDVKVGSGRVGVSGDLVVSTLYRGGEDAGVVEFVEHEVPFNQQLDAPGAQEGMHADVTLTPIDAQVSARPNSDGEDRNLTADVALAAVMKLYAQTDVNVLDDAYIVNKTLDFTRQRVAYPTLVCRNRNQCPVKEVIEIGDAAPDILQIVRVGGKAHLDDIRIVDDKVVADGVVDADIMYIAKSDDTPLYNYRACLPFRQAIETKGARMGMDAAIDKSVDHVGFNLLSDREIELRFLLSFNTTVVAENAVDIITDAKLEDVDRSVIDNMPSMTIYVVCKGDSLWSIAKRYNTSIEDILEVNDIADPNVIYPGQKLVIINKR
ncbi:MAG: DUF3794 domain-containing protein [Clostridiales bacterium]|jgi:LysM repeat protein|nr:DUF3794 domain-containing protein [Clostridiales bacterium]